MPSALPFGVVAICCVKDEAARRHWQGLLNWAERSHSNGSHSFTIRATQTLEEAYTVAAESLAHTSTGVILLSDMLLEPYPEWRPAWRATSAFKELAIKFARSPFVFVALSPYVERVPDVDLVVLPQYSKQKWITALDKLIARLWYLLPVPARLPRPPRVYVRALNTISEFRDALRLRRIVYDIMGYLDVDFLSTGSRLELTWSDRQSRQYGLFCPVNEHEQLIGTSRLVLTRGVEGKVPSWCDTIARTRLPLKALLTKQRRELAQFKLPIFHTLALDDELSEEAINKLTLGELSRVVVHPDWRGYRLASDLISTPLADADVLGVAKVFLECLPIHCSLYERFNFKSLDQKGVVLGVGRTMVGMRRGRESSAS